MINPKQKKEPVEGIVELSDETLDSIVGGAGATHEQDVRAYDHTQDVHTYDLGRDTHLTDVHTYDLGRDTHLTDVHKYDVSKLRGK